MRHRTVVGRAVASVAGMAVMRAPSARLTPGRRSSAASRRAAAATSRGRRGAGRRSGSGRSSWSRWRRSGCAAPACRRPGQGWPIAPVHRHALAKRRHLLRKAVARPPRGGARSIRSSTARVASNSRRCVVGGELPGQRQRREPRAVQDLVGVGVADAAEEPRVGQRALERVVLAREPGRECRSPASSTSSPPRSNGLQLALRPRPGGSTRGAWCPPR